MSKYIRCSGCGRECIPFRGSLCFNCATKDVTHNPTDISGYSVQYPQPAEPCCAAVARGEACVCQECPDDHEYVTDWRRRVDEDELEGPA